MSGRKGLEVGRHGKIDAAVILLVIMVIMISMVGQNSFRMVAGSNSPNEGRFLSAALIPHLSMDPSTAGKWAEVCWWIHILLVFGFLNYLPYSKHLHILTSVPNVYFSDLSPRGALKPINLEIENVEKFGATDVEDLTWKQLLDGYTCPEGGR